MSSFPQTKSVYDGETVSMPSPSKEGYTFSGWYTDTNGYGTQYTSYTSIHRDVTLYAYFKIKTYTVSFYSNGAGTSYPPKTVEYNGTISLPTPTISGYNFDGWYTSSSGGTNMSLLVGEILRPDYHIIPEILFPCVKTQL